MSDQPEPWEILQALIAEGRSQRVDQFLDGLSAMETVYAVSRLSQDDQSQLLIMLKPEDAADLIEEVTNAQAVDLIEHLSPEQAAHIVDELPSDQQADILGALSVSDAEAIIEEMAPSEAADVRDLLQYPTNTAGGVMITEYLAYSDEVLIANVLDDLRANREIYAHYDVQYGYVVSGDGKLIGVLRLRDLLLAPRENPLVSLMIPNPVSVPADMDIDDLHGVFDRYAFLGVPVVDHEDRLVGVVQRAAVDRAVGKQTEDVYLKTSGIVGGEELRSMGFFSRSLRRLSWLSVNIVLNIIAASVIAFFQDTLSAVIVLAVFLPIISDMSGCSGNQAVAVSIRELTLGLIKPQDVWRVFFKELVVGLMNGLVLGILLGTVAWLWQGNIYLGLVVGSALMINTLLAVCLGGLIPLVLRGMKIDPALAAGPLLTTLTDMCGFLFVLGFASLMLDKLVP
ncbi:MAG: magnesium transporter [Candidatus Latescibacterota bacterium]|jgi:magnesium transporter